MHHALPVHQAADLTTLIANIIVIVGFTATIIGFMINTIRKRTKR